MTAATTRRQRVLIIGGGIGGLALAGFLQRHSFDITLAERAPAWRPLGAGISLGPNAVGTLDELGIGDEIRRRGVVLRSGIIADERGRTLSVIDLEGIAREVGVPAVAIHRAELHDALLAAIDPTCVALKLGCSVDRIECAGDVAHVSFAGGERMRYDLVVGADGIHSRTRAALFGDTPPRYSGYVCWRFVVDGVSLAEPDVAIEFWGRGQRFGIVPIGDGRLYCFAAANAPGGKASMAHVDRDAFVALFSRFGGDVPRVLAALGPDHPLLLDDIADIPTAVWSRGPVTLLGDAAHATTPNLGQGAAMAIEDAMVLAGALVGNEGIPAALDAYRAARHRRVTTITARSLSLGRIGQIESPALIFLRNLALRLVPDRLAARGNVRVVLDAPSPRRYAPAATVLARAARQPVPADDDTPRPAGAVGTL